MAYADYDYELPQDEDVEDYLDYYEEVSHYLDFTVVSVVVPTLESGSCYFKH